MVYTKNQQQATVPYREGVFYIDEAPYFHGYKSNQYWNGWECPVFIKEEADKILQALIVNEDSATYDEKEDTFTVIFEADPESAEQYKGFDIVVEGITHHVYGIGAFSWCWSEKK